MVRPASSDVWKAPSVSSVLNFQYLFKKYKKQIKNNVSFFLFFLLKDLKPPKKLCASALGMENGKIPDTAIVASSRYNQYWGPERGRLNEKKDGNHF